MSTLAWTIGISAVLATVLLVYTTVVAPADLRLTRVDARIEGLPPAFEGYTIAVLADLHYGGTVHPMRHALRLARMTTEASPDLIALLGDYALSLNIAPRASRRLYEWAFPPLARVLATLHAPDGIVGVLGNHDYDYDAPSVARWLTRCGVHVLVNECVTFERDGARLAIGGVDDYEYGSIDVYGGCAEIPADVPRIVLSHNPDGVLRLDPRARVDLVLAGHTHGGQLVLPWFGAPARHCTICDADCASGWVRRAPVPLYVSAGAGALIPFRLGSRPEVVLVRLVRH